VVTDVDVQRLAWLVRHRQPCVVLTGAGMSAASGIPTFRGVWDTERSEQSPYRDIVPTSTESCIPDFRSAGGIWAQNDPYEVAHVYALRRDPARVWEFYALRLRALEAAQPNDGHRALAELEERGWIRAVVTQNVDGLHWRAGSREVVEVHGSLREAECVRCGVRIPMGEAVARLPLPDCPQCGEILKPGVVMFGELLPVEAIEQARRLAREAELLLVVGSSLEVHPVAALPGEMLAAGGTLAIVNRGGTPWDARAELVLDAGAGETLRALAAALDIVRADPPRRSDG
jgi:NAD-dependent deacetylase